MYKTSLCFHQLNYKTKTFEWWRQLKVQTMSLQHLHVHNEHRQSSNHNTSTKTQVTTSSQSITFKAHITFTFVSYARSQCLYNYGYWRRDKIDSLQFTVTQSSNISLESHFVTSGHSFQCRFFDERVDIISRPVSGRCPVGLRSAPARGDSEATVASVRSYFQRQRLLIQAASETS